MSNAAYTNELALDLGIDIINRRPLAKEVFKWQDIDLLPHSSEDTLLGEIFDWTGRNWRTTENNLIGWIFSGEDIPRMAQELANVDRAIARIPDFTFNKEHITELDFKIPSLFNLSFTGQMNRAKDLEVTITGVTKSRLTNYESPGIEVLNTLSKFMETDSRAYRREIKRNYLANALFYADSAEITIEKDSGVEVGVEVDVNNTTQEVKLDTETKKVISVKYAGNACPFAASMVKGKEFAS